MDYQYKELIKYRWYRIRYYECARTWWESGSWVDEIRVVKLPVPYRFRYDPVPDVHCHKRLHTYYRRIRTTQERRWAYAHEGYFRRKRNAKNLPNSWDDFYASKNRTRSWKRTKKKHQWE